MVRSRCSVVIAPPGMTSAPRRSAPEKADQKPMNGPKEKAKKTRACGCRPADREMWSAQIRTHQAQDSGGVEPAQRRRAARARRLVQPAVAIDGEGEGCAKRRIRLLVGRDLVFRGEGQSLEVVPGADGMEPRLVEMIALE